MKLDYPTLNPDIRELSVAATAGSVTAVDVMGIDSRAGVIGSSLRGEVGLDVIEALWEKKMTVAVDMQGFVRVLRDRTLFYEPWPEMQSALAHVHILKSDVVEAQHLTGQTDIYRAARFYVEMGPQEIVLTHKDGLLVYAGGEFFEAGFYPLSLDGRSGRADTCLGSYTALRLTMPPGKPVSGMRLSPD